jgi:hypothetical protein
MIAREGECLSVFHNLDAKIVWPQTQPIKVRFWVLPCKFRHWIYCVMSSPLANAVAPRHESPSQNLIAPKTRITITSPQISPSMPFFGTDFTTELRHVSWWQQSVELRIRSLGNQTVRKKIVTRDQNPSIPKVSRHVIHLEFTDGAFQNLTLWPDQWRHASSKSLS